MARKKKNTTKRQPETESPPIPNKKEIINLIQNKINTN